MSQYDIKFHYIHHCQTSKEIWDTLEMIYGTSLSIEQENMNIRGGEDKNTTLGYFSNFRIIGNYITNKYIRVNNWNFNPTLKSKYGNFHEFQEKSRKKEIIKDMNELVQQLKKEEAKTEELSTLSYSYHTTLVESFKRIN